MSCSIRRISAESSSFSTQTYPHSKISQTLTPSSLPNPLQHSRKSFSIISNLSSLHKHNQSIQILPHFQTLGLNFQIHPFAPTFNQSMAAAKPYSMVVGQGGRGHRSLAEYQWWKAVWDKRPVVIERPFDIRSFFIVDLPQFGNLVRYPGWDRYLKNEGNICNETICTEFLASLLPVENEPYSYVSYIRATYVYLNPASLSVIMGVEPLPEDSFAVPFTQPQTTPTPDQLASWLAKRPLTWPVNSSGAYTLFDRNLIHKDNYLLWLLVCNSLMPTHHHTKINLAHARIMDGIERNRDFCLVRFFIDQIASIYESTNMKDAIKMGVLITLLCEEAGVESLAEDVRSNQLSAVDQRTWNRVQGQFKSRPQDAPGAGLAPNPVGPDGQPIPQPGEQFGEGSSQAPRQKRRGSAGAVPLDMDVLIGRLDEMQATNQSHFTSLAEDSSRFRQQYNTDFGSLRTDIAAIRDQQNLMSNSIGFLEGRLSTFSADMETGFQNIGDQLSELLSHFPAPQSPPPDA